VNSKSETTPYGQAGSQVEAEQGASTHPGELDWASRWRFEGAVDWHLAELAVKISSQPEAQVKLVVASVALGLLMGSLVAIALDAFWPVSLAGQTLRSSALRMIFMVICAGVAASIALSTPRCAEVALACVGGDWARESFKQGATADSMHVSIVRAEEMAWGESNDKSIERLVWAHRHVTAGPLSVTQRWVLRCFGWFVSKKAKASVLFASKGLDAKSGEELAMMAMPKLAAEIQAQEISLAAQAPQARSSSKRARL
jgi:hypothetical protein